MTHHEVTEGTEVRGYRGPVPPIPELLTLLDKVRQERGPDTLVQLARAENIYGADHLRHAARLAHRAREDGTHLATDPAVEVLLYAAGVRQIDRALHLLGLEEGEDESIAAVAHGSQAGPLLDHLAREAGWTRDDAVLAGDASTLDRLGVDPAQRDAVPPSRWGDLVLEHVALLDVGK